MLRCISTLLVILPAITMLASQPLSLDSCRRMALEGNKDVRKQTIQIDEAGYQRKQARAAYLPTLDFEGGYTYNSRQLSLISEDALLPTKSFNPATQQYDYNLVTNPATGQPVTVNGQPVPSTVALLPKNALTYDVHNLFAGALTLTQPIYMGGKIKAMNAITGYTQELASTMRDSKMEDVVYNVDAAYWQVVSLKAKEKLAESYVSLVQSLDNDVKKMLEQGVATKANLLTVDVRLNEANVDLTKVKNGLVLARMSLMQLCGQPVNRQFTLVDENADNWATTYSPANYDINSVFKRRHDIHSLELATKIYNEQAKVARSEMLPSIAAIGMFHFTNPNSYNGYENRFGSAFTVGATVKIPLWHWGGLSNKYKAAQAEARIKELELDDAKDKIQLQVSQASFRYQESFKTYETAKANLTKADENLRIAQVSFKEGVATTDEVLTAQTAWLKANSEKIDAEIDVKLCDVYLSKVLGTMNVDLKK